MNKRYFFVSFVGVISLALLAWGSAARAASSNVVFDPGTGKLSVSGNCSARFVLVVIRRTSDGSIWGSSNPSCVNGSYAYAITVPAGDRMGGTFVVDAVDGGTVPGSATAAITSPSTASATVVFSTPIPLTDVTVTMDTSSLAAAPPSDDSWLDSVLQQFFGIVTSAVDAVKTSVVAAMQIFSKMFAVLPGGSIAVPKGANQMSGDGEIGAGVTDVFVPNTLLTSSSEVIVTPTSPTEVPLAVTQRSDGAGFHVGTVRSQSIPVSFSWLIISTYAAGSSTVVEQSMPVAFGGGTPDVTTMSAAAAGNAAAGDGDTDTVGASNDATTSDATVSDTTTSTTDSADIGSVATSSVGAGANTSASASADTGTSTDANTGANMNAGTDTGADASVNAGASSTSDTPGSTSAASVTPTPDAVSPGATSSDAAAGTAP
ncbi:MAG: hypothetical protein ABSE18_03575 [Minisyncoccia bacterium]